MVRAQAKARFGITRFRPGQQEIIEALLQQGAPDIIGIMPTGAGKSLCYQLPALFLPHATVVVSPLIALMQDQEDKLVEADIATSNLNSTLSPGEEREALERIEHGNSRLIYLTPERLEKPESVELLARAGVSLFVIDEAHCVSQWGHDFRPAYLALRDVVRAMGRPPVLALTATATPEVLDDIQQQLGLASPRVVNTGVDRPNLFFEVFRTVNDDVKRERLAEIIGAGRGGGGAGIVYVATVKLADQLFAELAGQGVRAGLYHARRPAGERTETQHRFMTGDLDVMVATKAFGMGIDKPDIRYVVHYNFPDSLESYYQEAGRAGRDGRPARAALLYRLEDKRIQTYFLGGKYPRRDQCRHVLEVLSRLSTAPAAAAGGVSMRALVEAAALPERKVRVIVALLAGAGVVARGRYLRKRREFANAQEMEAYLAAYEERHTADRERLGMMMQYAETGSCRVALLREYFGDPAQAACGHCDNCRGTEGSAAVLEVGDRN